MTFSLLLSGVRIEYFDWNTSDAASSLGDWPCLYLRHSQATAYDHLGNGQGPDPDVLAPT